MQLRFFFLTYHSNDSILLWSYPENLNASQALEVLQNRLILLGSTSVGNWGIDCEVLQSSAPGKKKAIHIRHIYWICMW